MEIKDFSELTAFIYSEHEKAAEALDMKKSGDAFIEFCEGELIKYQKMYAKPLFKQAKRELKLQDAINTMPHGFWWKIFHRTLWEKIKNLEFAEEENKDSPAPEKKTAYPIVQARALEPIDNKEQINYE